jgi:exopolysaccharide biosynthesis protein
MKAPSAVAILRSLLHHKLVALTVATWASAVSALAQPLPESVLWEKLSSGLEQTNFRINGDSIISSSIALVRSDMQSHRIATIRASEFGWKHATVQALCKASGAVACINANFFDEQGKPLGLIISRGIIHQKIHKGGGLLTGILFVTPKSVGVAFRDTFSTEGVVEAVQAGPRLVSRGAIVEGLKESARSSNLSGICIDAQQRVSIFRVTSGVFGGSLHQLQNVLTDPQIGCVEALNFDGGGSSSMYISGEIQGHAGAVREENFPGTDEVPVAIGLFPLATVQSTPSPSDMNVPR